MGTILSNLAKAAVSLSLLVLGGCLLSEPPNLLESELAEVPDVVGSYRVYSAAKGSKTSGTGRSATVRHLGNRRYQITINNPPDKKGNPKKPTVHQFRLLTYRSPNVYVALIDKGFGKDTAYTLLTRQKNGNWSLSLFAVRGKERNIRAEEIAYKHGITLHHTNQMSGAKMSLPLEGRRIVKLLRDREFLAQATLNPFYRLVASGTRTSKAPTPTPQRRSNPDSKIKSCGVRKCVKLSDGRTIYRTRQFKAWYFKDGKLVPRNLWPE